MLGMWGGMIERVRLQRAERYMNIVADMRGAMYVPQLAVDSVIELLRRVDQVLYDRVWKPAYRESYNDHFAAAILKEDCRLRGEGDQFVMAEVRGLLAEIANPDLPQVVIELMGRAAVKALCQLCIANSEAIAQQRRNGGCN